MGGNEMNKLTQHLKLFAVVVFSTCLLVACSRNNTQSNKDSASDRSATSGTSSSGDASFSATIDGSNISGHGIDELQVKNTAFTYPGGADKASKRLLFFLFSTKNGSDTKPDYSFRFSIPDKEGVFTKNLHDDQPYDITLDFLTGDLSRYWSQAVTVTLTSITASRVTGTFSGKFILSDDTPRGSKKEVTITDGKFDVPFSTGNVKPE
jgi:hypothetical protein